MDLGLDGRVVLITGGYRGTGAGTARVFAQEGARVAVHGFEDGQADEVVAEIRSGGGRAVAVYGSLGDVDGVEQVVSAAEAELGPIEVLVNNYGAPGRSDWTTPAEEWTDGWERNVLTAVRVSGMGTGGLPRHGRH